MAKTVTRNRKPINFKTHTKRMSHSIINMKMTKGSSKTISDILCNLIANLTNVAVQHAELNNRKTISKRNLTSAKSVLLGNNVLFN